MSRSFRLGVFIIATLSILATGSFLIGDRLLMFSSTYQLNTTFKSVTGLDEGAEVRVGGIHRGIVKRIELPAGPDGEMTVILTLARSTRKVLRVDSVASIQTEGLLGNKYVDVSFGSPGAPEIEDGAHIASVTPVEMSDLMKKANDVLANVADGSDSLKQIVAKVNEGQGTIGALVNDKKMYTQLDQATKQATSGATAFQEDMEALKHNFFLRGFFSSRGYADASRLGEHDIAHLPAGQPLRTFHYDGNKIFSDASDAKLKSEKSLKDAGDFLQGAPFGTAVIVAASGMKGDAKDVHVLTQARAMVVRDYLVKNFRMDDTRVKTMGLGKTADAPDDAGTVEILVYPNASGKGGL